MFKNVEEVNNAPDETIINIVNNSWNANLNDILTTEDCNILEQAKLVETKAEEIAFAIRNRFNSIIENDDNDEVEDDIDEFMNSIALNLNMKYNEDYQYRPDSFWIPSTC